jgi:adenylosuccinate lyase
MGALFADKHKFDTWLKVELAVCEEWARLGKVPKAAYDRIKRKASFRLPRIREIEDKVHHDVIAFTTAVGEHIGEDSAWFHKGLTSSDVVDTAQSIVLREAGELLEKGLEQLTDTVGKRALDFKLTPAMGRTHGVHAEPTTLGLKFLVWYDELGRHQERLAAAIASVSVGKLSGAVGNFAHLNPEFEERVLKKLGLHHAPVSNQVVQRDRHAEFICALAQLGATLEKIAINLRAWQRTEIGEVQEPFAPGQKGSSAMPHKKNPILLERITGLSRVLRGYAVTSLENVALWDERDISHSGAERVILPDACILADYMMFKLNDVVARLEVRERRLERNIYYTKGLIFSQRVLLALTEAGMSREDAYAIVQRNALRCWEDDTPLLDALMSDPDVRKAIDQRKLPGLFDLDPYLAHVDRIFDRVGLKIKGGKQTRRRKPAPAAQPRTPTAQAPVSGGAVQNIMERAEDYYESSHILAKGGKAEEGDETLGEAAHQKKRVRKSSPKDPEKKPARRRRSSAKPKTEKSETGDNKHEEPPKEEAPEEKKDEKKKPSSRRRRGGRRKTGATGDRKPSESNPDDTYVD